MSKYKTHVAELEDQIGKQMMLRNAQAPDSENRAYFQKEINDLTSELLRLKGAIPQLEALDERIERAQRDVHRAARDVHGDAARSRPALWCASLGIPMILLSLVWTPTAWLPVIGVALIVAAALFLVRSMQTRRFASDQLYDAHEEVADLQQRRRFLLESLTTSTVPQPLIEVQALTQADHDVTELAELT